MPLNRLVISNFRNIESAELDIGSGINVISGANASGKTSFLESISLLCHGRSFRTKNYRNLININSDHCMVVGSIRTDYGKSEIGIQRYRDGTFRINLNGESLSSASQLAQVLPLQIINSDSFRVLEGQAKDRRKLFDWIVFHVKPEFRKLWNQYSIGLKHRNSLIRTPGVTYCDVEPWDVELSKIAEQISLCRTECVASLNIALESVLETFECDIGTYPLSSIRCRHMDGWDPSSGSLSRQLKLRFQKDLELGYTYFGPHRSEFKLVMKGNRAIVDFLSRGQQKTIIGAFYTAQRYVLKEYGIKEICLLVDDMQAELDIDNLKTYCDWILDGGSQTFISCIIADPILNALSELNYDHTPKVFHVKQGSIKEQAC